MPADPNPYASPAPTGPDDRPPPAGDAELLHRGWLRRRVRLAGPTEAVVEYSGRGFCYDTVRVNDRVAAWRWRWLWFAPRFDFAVTLAGEKKPAVLTVAIDSLLRIARLTIEVDDRLVYEEHRTP